MRIPRDLKSGDRLWYSKTEYATVANRMGAEDPYGLFGYIRAIADRTMWYKQDGVEVEGDTPCIIRIERIASKPKKAKVDRDAAYLLRIHGDPSQNKRIRAIARRLNGGAL